MAISLPEITDREQEALQKITERNKRQQAVNPSMIAVELGTTKAAATRLLRSLERKKLIAPVYYVAPTKTGERAVNYKNGLTAREFVQRAIGGRLGKFDGYFPSWMAPDGLIYIGSSHYRIAEQVGTGSYTSLYNKGFLRLLPGVRFNYLSVDAPKTAKPTPQQIAALSVLAKTFIKPANTYDGSYVMDRKNLTVEEFLAAVRAWKPERKDYYAESQW